MGDFSLGPPCLQGFSSMCSNCVLIPNVCIVCVVNAMLGRTGMLVDDMTVVGSFTSDFSVHGASHSIVQRPSAPTADPLIVFWRYGPLAVAGISSHTVLQSWQALSCRRLHCRFLGGGVEES